MKQYPKEINSWAEYVNGQDNRPKMPAAKTVISSSLSELAPHKPVIKVSIGNRDKNVLLDTECDTNVVDLKFFISLCKNKEVKIFYRSGSLKCANGS